MAAIALLGSFFDSNTGTHSVTATPTANDLIVIVTANTGSTVTNVAPTDNQGGTYVEITGARAVKATSADTMQVWVRSALVSSAVSTIYSSAPGTTTGGGLYVFRISGMSKTGTSAVKQAGIQSNIASGTPAIALGAAAATADLMLSVVFSGTNSALTAPTGWTITGTQSGFTSPATGIRAATIASGFTGSTVTWGASSSSAFCSNAIEFDTSASGPTGTLTATEGADTASLNAVIVNPDLSTFTENFTTLDTSVKWFSNPSGAGFSATSSSGQLALAIPTSDATTGAIVLTANSSYNLKESSVYVRFVNPIQASNLPTASFGIDLSFGLIDSSPTAPGARGPIFLWDCKGNLGASYYNTAGSNIGVNSATYSATSHAWLRIRESAGTVYWETAPDASGAPGTWSVLGSAATSDVCAGWPSLNDVQVRFFAERWGSTGATITGPAVFDNINVAAVVADNATLAASETGADTAAFTGSAQVINVTSFAPTEGNDALNASGTVPVAVKTFALNESADTASFSGSTRRATANFSANFDSALDSSVWTDFSDSTCSAAASGGTLNLTVPSGNTSLFATIDTVEHFTLVGSSAYVRFVQPLQGAFTTYGCEVYFQLQQQGHVSLTQLQWAWTSDGFIKAIYDTDGAATVLQSLAYSPTDHAWLRVREASGTVYFDTAPDASGAPGTWTNQASVTTATMGWTPDNLVMSMEAGNWQSAGASITGPAKFDNLNTTAVVADNAALNASETGSDTAAAAGAVLVQGTAASSETGSDTAAIAGTVPVSGAMGATEAADVAAASGAVLVSVKTFTVSEAGVDVAAASGSVIISVTSFAPSETGSDTAAMVAQLTRQGSLAGTETADTASLTATGPWWNAALSAAEGADTAAAAGAVLVNVQTFSPTEAADTASLTATGPWWNAALAGTEASDSAAAAGAVLVSVKTFAVSEQGADTAAAAGSVIVTAGLSASETGSDTAAAAGAVLVQGAIASTEAADTAAAAGQVIVSSSLAGQEASDTALFTAGNFTNASMAATEATDTASFAGTVVPFLATGSLAASEPAGDTAAITVVHVSTGSLAAAESPDIVAFTGKVQVQGLLDTTEARDTAAVAGAVLVQGTVATGETGLDTAALSAKVLIAGTAAAQEGADTATIAGQVPVQGALTTSEQGEDTAVAAGAVLVQANFITSEEGDDLAALSGAVLVRGAIGASEDADAAEFDAGVLVQADLAVSEEGNDQATMSGAVLVQGLADASEAVDTSEISGAVLVQGGMVALEQGDDRFSASTGIFASGVLQATEGGDTSQIFAVHDSEVTLAAAEDDDTAEILVVHVSGASIAAAEDDDGFTAAGAVLVQAGMAALEDADSFLARARHALYGIDPLFVSTSF